MPKSGAHGQLRPELRLCPAANCPDDLTLLRPWFPPSHSGCVSNHHEGLLEVSLIGQNRPDL